MARIKHTGPSSSKKGTEIHKDEGSAATKPAMFQFGRSASIESKSSDPDYVSSDFNPLFIINPPRPQLCHTDPLAYSNLQRSETSDRVLRSMDPESSSSQTSVAERPKLTPVKRSNNKTQEDAYLSRPEVRIPCPDQLKSILVDDWENVTRNLCLVSLPSKTPANTVIDDWYAHEKSKRREGSSEMEILEEMHSGLKEYFRKALGRILLYTFEREQYSEMIELWEKAAPGSEWDGKGPGDVYGAEHLARLVGKSKLIHPSIYPKQPTAPNTTPKTPR